MTERLTYTVKEAAIALGVSTAHVYKLLNQNQIPGLRAGHRWLVPKAALYRLLNNEAQESFEDWLARESPADLALLQRVTKERADQGLPTPVQDPAALRAIARLLGH